MTQQNTLRAVFWAVLVLFLAWDHLHSPPVDLRFEAPLIAAGSGKATQGGHCSMPAGKLVKVKVRVRARWAPAPRPHRPSRAAVRFPRRSRRPARP